MGSKYTLGGVNQFSPAPCEEFMFVNEYKFHLILKKSVLVPKQNFDKLTISLTSQTPYWIRSLSHTSSYWLIEKNYGILHNLNFWSISSFGLSYGPLLYTVRFNLMIILWWDQMHVYMNLFFIMEHIKFQKYTPSFHRTITKPSPGGSEPHVLCYDVHLLMGTLLLMKALNLICAAEEANTLRSLAHHTTEMFCCPISSSFTSFCSSLLSSWSVQSFLKPLLEEREKKVLMVVIPLQVLANMASVAQAKVDRTARIGLFGTRFSCWWMLSAAVPSFSQLFGP